MALREIFLLAVSTAAASAFLPRATALRSAALWPPSTSPDWLRRVLAAGFTATQKGLTK